MNINNSKISSKLDLKHLSTEINLTEEQFNELHMLSYTYEEFLNLKDLNNLNLNDFLSRFEIYSSYNEAKNKINRDFKNQYLEIHHIEDVSIQLKKYNKEHGTSYNRNFFKKNCAELFDDRSIIVSSFEHALCHYLNIFKGKEYKSAFYAFVSFCEFQNNGNLLDILIQIGKNREILIDKNKETLQEKKNKMTNKDKAYDFEKRSKLQKELYANLSEEEKQKRRDNTRKALSRPETRKKLSECSKGQYVWNNGIVEIKTRECPSPDFVRGLLPQNKMRNSVNKGKISYTDGYHNVFLKPEDPIPEGYYKGMTIRNKPNKSYSPLGKIKYNNGIEVKYFNKDEEIPSGWIKGDLPRGRLYNNGQISKVFKEDEKIPEGWVKGIIVRKIKEPSNKGKICYNNGIENKYFSLEDSIPEGFTKGFIRNKNKGD